MGWVFFLSECTLHSYTFTLHPFTHTHISDFKIARPSDVQRQKWMARCSIYKPRGRRSPCYDGRTQLLASCLQRRRQGRCMYVSPWKPETPVEGVAPVGVVCFLNYLGFCGDGVGALPASSSRRSRREGDLKLAYIAYATTALSRPQMQHILCWNSLFSLRYSI